MQVILDTCEDLFNVKDAQKNFLHCIVSGDEKWCLNYNTHRKSNGMIHFQYVTNSPQKEKIRIVKSSKKIRPITVFDTQDQSHKAFLPERALMNTNA